MKQPHNISPTPVPSASTSTATPAAAGVKHTAISAEHQKKWADTMSMMIWTAPGFQHILYKLLNAQGNTPSDYVAIMSEDAGIACTDGKNIVVNPKRFFDEFSLPERVFITAHEIVHNVYGDVELLHRCQQSGKVPANDGTFKPFNNDIMQRAMDARINALLMESRIGKAPKVGHFDPEVKANDSVLDVYQKYYEDEAPDSGGNNPGGFDNLQKPGSATGQNPGSAASARNPQQWAVEIAAAQTIEQAKAQGKMAGGLKRMFQTLLEPEVPWIDHIETLINRTVGDGGIDWTQPNPWFGAFDFFVPAETGKGAGWIVVWGDTSGSRSDAELASNMSELAGIMEAVNPARLTVLWCDAAVDFIDEIEDPVDLAKIQSRGTGGGGGTSYKPVSEWIAAQGPDVPDLFIGFTDGYVSFPKRAPKFPVIWASSTDKEYPFGQVVRVNKIARTP